MKHYINNIEMNLNESIHHFKIFVTLLFILTLSSNLLAQDSVGKKDVDTTQEMSSKLIFTDHETIEATIYPLTISKKAGHEQVVHDGAYLLQELQRIEYNIYAIDDKIKNVSNDPEKKDWAEKNGWFEQMNNQKAILIQRKKAIDKEIEIIQK